MHWFKGLIKKHFHKYIQLRKAMRLNKIKELEIINSTIKRKGWKFQKRGDKKLKMHIWKRLMWNV